MSKRTINFDESQNSFLSVYGDGYGDGYGYGNGW